MSCKSNLEFEICPIDAQGMIPFDTVSVVSLIAFVPFVVRFWGRKGSDASPGSSRPPSWHTLPLVADEFDVVVG